jgi:hypothetical protein
MNKNISKRYMVDFVKSINLKTFNEQNGRSFSRNARFIFSSVLREWESGP